MKMTVNVTGQVGQIKLGQNMALWPLFETVINSIQSLEDTDIDQKEITIEALRNPNVQLRLNVEGKNTGNVKICLVNKTHKIFNAIKPMLPSATQLPVFCKP